MTSWLMCPHGVDLSGARCLQCEQNPDPYDQYYADRAKVKVAEAKRLLQEWVNKQGHERCWYYPEIFRPLAELFGIEMTVDPQRPPRSEFEGGCTKFQDEEYKSGSNESGSAESAE